MIQKWMVVVAVLVFSNSVAPAAPSCVSGPCKTPNGNKGTCSALPEGQRECVPAQEECRKVVHAALNQKSLSTQETKLLEDCEPVMDSLESLAAK